MASKQPGGSARSRPGRRSWRCRCTRGCNSSSGGTGQAHPCARKSQPIDELVAALRAVIAGRVSSPDSQPAADSTALASAFGRIPQAASAFLAVREPAPPASVRTRLGIPLRRLPGRARPLAHVGLCQTRVRGECGGSRSRCRKVPGAFPLRPVAETRTLHAPNMPQALTLPRAVIRPAQDSPCGKSSLPLACSPFSSVLRPWLPARPVRQTGPRDHPGIPFATTACGDLLGIFAAADPKLNKDRQMLGGAQDGAFACVARTHGSLKQTQREHQQHQQRFAAAERMSLRPGKQSVHRPHQATDPVAGVAVASRFHPVTSRGQPKLKAPSVRRSLSRPSPSGLPPPRPGSRPQSPTWSARRVRAASRNSTGVATNGPRALTLPDTGVELARRPVAVCSSPNVA